MPTEIVKYVDPDGGVLADYTSFPDALNGEEAIRKDLVSRDEELIFILQSSAGSDLPFSTIANGKFITDATHRVIIRGEISQVWDDSLPVLVVDAQNVYNNVVFHNLQIKDNSTGGFASGSLIIRSGVLFLNCHLWSNAFSARKGIYCYSGAAKFVNSVFRRTNELSASDGLFCDLFYGQTNLVYNCVVTGFSNIGIRNSGGGSSPSLFKNNIVQGAGIGYYYANDSQCANNISNTSTVPGANSYSNTTVNFADASAGDFRLLAGSPGIDQGVDLSSDPSYPFNTDIIGTVRPQGAAWDIGAFELIQQTFNPAWAKHSNQIIRAI